MSHKVLIVTAVASERESILAALHGDERFDIIAGGVGPAAAAASTAIALSGASYRYVFCMGIGGSYREPVQFDAVVIADEVIAADLGAESPEGFIRLDELGFGETRIPADRELANLVATTLRQANVQVTTGSILTVSTTTGTEQTATKLKQRFPQASAEGMEGYGVAVGAQKYQIPFIEIRTVSNKVGLRDRAAWKIKEALAQLTAISTILRKGLPL
jgi:futalosine hydrolase